MMVAKTNKPQLFGIFFSLQRKDIVKEMNSQFLCKQEHKSESESVHAKLFIKIDYVNRFLFFDHYIKLPLCISQFNLIMMTWNI